LLAACFSAQAQIGGRLGYAFLQQVPSARAAALGGVLPQNTEEDGGAMFYNPAGVASSGIVGVGYNPAKNRFRYSSLAGMQNSWGGTAGASLQYMDYGTFQGYTPDGTYTGTYSANAYTLTTNYSKALGPFRFGANVKFAGATIESYSQYGMGFDLGATYKHPKADFAAGFVLQNVGVSFKNMVAGQQRSWPTTLSAGVSYKFEHMPVRFYGTAQQLQQWDIVYLDPNYNVKTDANGQEVSQKKTFTDKLFRHVTIGAELLLGKNVRVMGGYSHLLRREMRIENASSGASGFSLGTFIKLKAYRLAYTHTFIATSAGNNYFTLGYVFGQKSE